jgi:HTH-type transcriptional regulator / antitoxin HigA
MQNITIKPIRTPADLAKAKARLRELLNANEAGSHDDEIEVLSTLAEQFEKSHALVDAPLPVAAIKFRMEEMGLTPRRLEPFIGSRARVSEVLSGKRQLSIDMIRSLHEGLGIPYESLMSERPRTTHIAQVAAHAITRRNTQGFEVGHRDTPFIASLPPDNAPIALLRKTRTQRTASKTDQQSLMLWQKMVLKKSESIKLENSFQHRKFSAQDLRRIAMLSTRSDGPSRAFRNLAASGISVVTVPPLPGTFLDGAAMTGPTGNPVIGLTLRHDRVDSFWFTLLHELSHVALHYRELLQGKMVFVDDMDIWSEDSNECEADELARESLIPSSILSQIHWGPNTTHDELVAASVRARVHVAVVAGRWQRDHQNYKKFSRLIERGTVRAMLGMP